MLNPLGTTRHVALLSAALFLLSCDADERIKDDGGQLDPNDPEQPKLCAQRRQDYLAFLDKHSACKRDDECAMVGDCGPHADFDAVRADARDEAMRRKVGLCEGAFDGPIFEPVCRSNKCALKMRTDTCCGCPPDAGN